jgi:hypothetical protein
MSWFRSVTRLKAFSASTSVTRSFTGFQQAAEEAAFSRVLGGIHYAFDNADGLATGRAVGNWTLQAFHRIAADRGPVIVLDHPLGDASKGMSGRTGFALDNRAPVAAVTVTVTPEGRASFSVAVDDRGRFAIPTRRFETVGVRHVVLTARAATGRVVTARLELDGAEDTGTVTAPVTVK